MDYGIDVSKYDGLIDWRKARDEGGLKLAMIKASEGTTEDPLFKAQEHAADGILPKVYYHFIRSNISGLDQACKFWSVVEPVYDPTTDILAVDFETKDGQTNDVCLLNTDTFLTNLMRKNIPAPLLYTYPSFWKGIGGETKAPWASKYPLWLAQWLWDIWVIDLFPITPLFGGSRLADLKTKIETGAKLPMPLCPWTTVDDPYPDIWQVTARLDPKAIPGYPVGKKAVDLDAIYMDIYHYPSSPAPVPPVPVQVHYVTTVGLWVLSGPGNQFRAIAHIDAGVTVVKLEVSGTYARIAYNGITGWVASSCLKAA